MGNWIELYKSIKELYGDEPEHKLIEYLGLIEKGKILDLGTGCGRNSLFFSEIGFDVEAIDISHQNINKYIQKSSQLNLNTKAKVMDIRNFDISEGSYSLIIVSWVLNFFKKSEIDLIINNIKKGLKPNGIVYFTAFSTLDDYYIKNLDKSCGEKNTLYFDDYDCYRYYYDNSDEVLELFKGLEALSVSSGMELDIDEEIGNHYHHTIEYIGKKIE
ncbi:class I SAM-dependent methyltransferase [Paraclostridium benzoelyticum]|uniref:class I SAM-dependent methyltransferase n=1 Tax=Paraclostridium benzoelyticum TaxID=1629550 RepID=UPI0031CD36F9